MFGKGMHETRRGFASWLARAGLLTAGLILCSPAFAADPCPDGTYTETVDGEQWPSFAANDTSESANPSPRVAFRNVRTFRKHLEDAEAVPDVLDRNEQPLCGEPFGVQAEIFAAQLSEEIDLSDAKVRLWWYPGGSPWGFRNWKNDPLAKSAWMAESSDAKVCVPFAEC